MYSQHWVFWAERPETVAPQPVWQPAHMLYLVHGLGPYHGPSLAPVRGGYVQFIARYPKEAALAVLGSASGWFLRPAGPRENRFPTGALTEVVRALGVRKESAHVIASKARRAEADRRRYEDRRVVAEVSKRAAAATKNGRLAMAAFDASLTMAESARLMRLARRRVENPLGKLARLEAGPALLYLEERVRIDAAEAAAAAAEESMRRAVDSKQEQE